MKKNMEKLVVYKGAKYNHSRLGLEKDRIYRVIAERYIKGKLMCHLDGDLRWRWHDASEFSPNIKVCYGVSDRLPALGESYPLRSMRINDNGHAEFELVITSPIQFIDDLGGGVFHVATEHAVYAVSTIKTLKNVC